MNIPPFDGNKIVDKDSPIIFICHASEDKNYAASLYAKLEQAGIRPWLDKENLENLRGGDNWDEEIRIIMKESNYVVILQSSNLAKKIEGYVNKKIKMALDRQMDFVRGIRFIIPVKIDDGPLLEELEHLHAYDLTDKANMKHLINAIKRDFEKRKSR